MNTVTCLLSGNHFSKWPRPSTPCHTGLINQAGTGRSGEDIRRNFLLKADQVRLYPVEASSMEGGEERPQLKQNADQIGPDRERRKDSIRQWNGRGWASLERAVHTTGSNCQPPRGPYDFLLLFIDSRRVCDLRWSRVYGHRDGSVIFLATVLVRLLTLYG